MNSEHIISLDGVKMIFNLSKDKIGSLKEYVIRLFQRRLFYDEFVALEGITFQLDRGEVLGIIGLNGAGKSTLLKLIAGVLKPTEGKVRTRGTIAPLIELGAGFDMELSAADNIYLNGAVLGYSKKLIESRFQEILEFAELEAFVDVPVKNFSSGMIARLGFAIATIVDPDILIVDEVLSVGDFKFGQKSENKIKEMIAGGTTVLFVSHSADAVRRICGKCLFLEHGKMVAFGETEEVLKSYEERYA